MRVSAHAVLTGLGGDEKAEAQSHMTGVGGERIGPSCGSVIYQPLVCHPRAVNMLSLSPAFPLPFLAPPCFLPPIQHQPFIAQIPECHHSVPTEEEKGG
jgi:hypothetical protein